MSTTQTAQQHALSAANDILDGIYETWKEGRTLDQCVTIASKVLGVDERTIQNAVLFSLTGGKGFVPTAEGAWHHPVSRYGYAG